MKETAGQGLFKSRVSGPINDVVVAVAVEGIEGPNHHGLPALMIAKTGG